MPRLYDKPAFAGEEIVILNQLLPHKTSERLLPAAVQHVVSRVKAARDVRNLAAPGRVAAGCEEEEFLVVELVGPIEPLVFRRADVLQASEDILVDEGIRKQNSDDLESVWHKAK